MGHNIHDEALTMSIEKKILQCWDDQHAEHTFFRKSILLEILTLEKKLERPFKEGGGWGYC